MRSRFLRLVTLESGHGIGDDVAHGDHRMASPAPTSGSRERPQHRDRNALAVRTALGEADPMAALISDAGAGAVQHLLAPLHADGIGTFDPTQVRPGWRSLVAKDGTGRVVGYLLGSFIEYGLARERRNVGATRRR